jgi:nitrogen fixation NifU-like protein
VDRETRIAWLVDHSRRPRHRGTLEDADVRVPGGNPGCGDLVTLYLKAEDGEDRVAAVSFAAQAEGPGLVLEEGHYESISAGDG